VVEADDAAGRSTGRSRRTHPEDGDIDADKDVIALLAVRENTGRGRAPPGTVRPRTRVDLRSLLPASQRAQGKPDWLDDLPNRLIDVEPGVLGNAMRWA
jgi:hypothetical protein